ncbi:MULTISPECIES: hypothetical protein [Microbacteriaceae]|uniref:hypothetical protein n=1 Tax=Microbacteriaceae TaxID=85023 RepID=UPI0003659464|nr:MULTISPECIES: hypothetical protein [Microbacteriaceae]TDQ03853.1 hypothetical protein AXZ95_2153 [Leifsonia sp. 115AMFTsu3.1]
MYGTATPIVGGIAGATALATTGFDAFAYTFVAAAFVLVGLALVRANYIRRRRATRAATAASA